MNCQNHPEVPATAYCRTCGKPVCEECRRDAYGTVFCAEHVPAPATAAGAPGGAPYTSAPPTTPPPPSPGPATGAPPFGTFRPDSQFMNDVSPGLAFFLGWIPGVGAIYNGQYAKGLVHVVIFGSIISILSSGAAQGFVPLFGLMIPTFVFYMAFEAYHTAKKRRDGEMVDEFSGLVRSRGARARFPMAPVLLIGFGLLFLLDNLDLLKIGRLLRYWPALLIALGLYLLFERIAESKYEPKQ